MDFIGSNGVMRRRAPKRRRATQGSGSAFKIAKAALSGVKKLRSATETKFVKLVSSANIPAAAVGLLSFYLSDVDQGDGQGTRDGVDIKPTSLFFRYGVRRAITSTNEHDYVRIVVVRNAHANAINPQLSSVFASADVFSGMNRFNAAQFTVIYDKLHHLSDVGPGALTKKKYIRLSRTTSYFGTGGATVDANRNSYHLFRFCDAADNFPVLDLDVTFNYKDP